MAATILQYVSTSLQRLRRHDVAHAPFDRIKCSSIGDIPVSLVDVVLFNTTLKRLYLVNVTIPLSPFPMQNHLCSYWNVEAARVTGSIERLFSNSSSTLQRLEVGSQFSMNVISFLFRPSKSRMSSLCHVNDPGISNRGIVLGLSPPSFLSRFGDTLCPQQLPVPHVDHSTGSPPKVTFACCRCGRPRPGPPRQPGTTRFRPHTHIQGARNVQYSSRSSISANLHQWRDCSCMPHDPQRLLSQAGTELWENPLRCRSFWRHAFSPIYPHYKVSALSSACPSTPTAVA